MPSLLPIALALFAWADPPAATAPAPSPIDLVQAIETVLGEAIARAEPSVVAINRDKSENEETLAIRGRNNGRDIRFERRLVPGGLANLDPFNENSLSFDYGSGVVIGDHGEILTAFHVVRGAKSLTVRAVNRQVFAAEIIAADPRSDLAVIAPRESPGVPPPTLKPVAIGDATKLRKGAFLIALGNPYNSAKDGRASASWGILSNVARRLDPSAEELNRQDFQLRHYPTLLQLDAKLNIGMSGGAVINSRGELVGLTTSAANASGFDAQAGYAIPMDALGRKVVEALRQGREYEYGFLGIRLDPQGSNRVNSADPGTPAALGGVQVDDLITAVGDVPVNDSESLVVAINSIPAGEPVVMKLIRKNEPIERTVELAKLKVKVPGIATSRPAPFRGLRVDYTSTMGSATFAPELFDAMSREGVLVTEVVPGSEADKAGIKTNQIISRVDGEPVRNPRAFEKAVSGRKGPVKVETDQGPITLK